MRVGFRLPGPAAPVSGNISRGEKRRPEVTAPSVFHSTPPPPAVPAP